MPYSINGIGTKFYGKRDFRPDGSYITTEWVTLMFLPLIPFRSMRVQYAGPAEPRFPLVGSADSYQVSEKGPPNLKQVLYIYAYAALVVLWFYVLTEKAVKIDDGGVAMAMIFGGILIPAPLP